MALVVEDGTIVANANSYNDLTTIKAYAVARNRVLPDDDEIVSGYAIRAMDYLESFREQYKGTITDLTQTLQFPRTGVVIDDIELGENAIPGLIIAAQNQLIIEQSAGIVLQPTLVREGRVKRKTIGPITTEWFDSEATGIAPQITAVDIMIGPLLNMQFGLRTLRV
jgi:hypothetical protein